MKCRYNINNLDCANCAREIEEALNKNDKLNNVIVNFSTSKISYETDFNISLKELNDLVQEVEPDATVTREEVKEEKGFSLWILIIGVLIGVLGYFLPVNEWIKNGLMILSYVLLLYKTFINSVKLLWKSKTINENLLITISCIGAYIIGERLEGIMVIGLYTIGKLLEERAVNKSRKSVKDLIDIKENFAYRKDENEINKIKVEDIKIGDILVIKRGEKVPVDGVVVKGESLLDTSMLTGESELVKVNVNDNILSGVINTFDVIEMKVTNLFEDSMVSKILDLLDEATDKKTKTETMVSKISKIYTPIVLLFAVIATTVLYFIFHIELIDSIYRGLVFLVISCPCAIAISVPLSYFTGIGASGKNGILVKGSTYLDNLGNIDKIIFDKTGTLTSGSFMVTNIDILDNNYTKDEIINILVRGESLSEHPIAKSILKLETNIKDDSEVLEYKEIDGKGISFVLNNDQILIGNSEICDCENEAILHLNINGKHIASIEISDGIKENTFDVIQKLKKLNIKTYMFTGDKKEVANMIGKKLEIDEIKYEMLPTDKYKNYEEVCKDSKVTVFVGDGINDAPVLKRADIGISMGNLGSDVAIEASDMVIMGDDLSKIPTAIDISKFTRKIIKQNLIFACSVKLIILILSVFGLANMWFAVFADTGVTLLTVINTLRILHNK